MPSAKFYAVARGKSVGVFTTWAEAQPLVTGVHNARYKSFPTRGEAESFIAANSDLPQASGANSSIGSVSAFSPIQSQQRHQEKYYAVARGKGVGVFRSWAEAQPLVVGVVNARYKSFPTRDEAEAFVRNESVGAQLAASIRRAAATDDSSVQGPLVSSGSLSSSAMPTSTFGASSSRSAYPTTDYLKHQRLTPPLVAYTDGACPNNGTPSARAGYGVYYPKKENFSLIPLPADISRPVPATLNQTNNVGELMAVIAAVKQITERDRSGNSSDDDSALAQRRRQPLIIYTDSQYCLNGATKWLKGWAAKGFDKKKSNGANSENSETTLKNAGLWRELDALLSERKTQMEKGLTTQSGAERTLGAKSVRDDCAMSATEARQMAEKYAVQFVHVRGHQGIEGNEMADQLAVRGAIGA